MASPAHATAIDVLASAALGDELGGQAAAVDLFDDGTVAVAGADEHGGTLVLLDDSGVAVASTRFAAAVEDLALDRRTGRIAIVSASELVALDGDLGVLWRTSLPNVAAERSPARIAVGELGTIAIVAAGELRTFSAAGDALGIATVPDSTSAVAVLDGNDLVVTTGSHRACDDRLDVATLAGFDREGVLRWRAYADDVDCESNGTRGIDVARGEDGMIYLLAEVDGVSNVFASAKNVGFDVLTTVETTASSRFAYYARFTPAGEHVAGQFFGFDDEDAILQPHAIAADTHGNVMLVGTTTHTIVDDDEAIHSEPLYAPAGWYQVVRADLGARLLWRSLEIDDMSTEGAALALAGPRVIALVRTTVLPNAREHAPIAGPMVLTWPTDPHSAVHPKSPDRDDVGTFGYESGVAGSDPTCHGCGPTRAPRPFGIVVLVTAMLLGRARKRGRSTV